MKVDLELLRDAREIKQGKTISEDNAELLGKADIIWHNHPVFCDRCGETNPENGFYPGRGFFCGGKPSRRHSLSGIHCNDCNKQRRIR